MVDSIGHPEAAYLLTKYDYPGQAYERIRSYPGSFEDDDDFPFDDTTELIQSMQEAGIDRLTGRERYEEEHVEDAEVPEKYMEREPDGTTRDYKLLGQDAEFGHLHFYRTTPEHAEFLVFDFDEDSGDLHEKDRMRVWRGPPTRQVEQYRYQQRPWSDQREIETPDYDLLPDPEHLPDLNEVLGGTLDLDGYRFPFRAPFDTVAKILKAGTEGSDDVFVDYRNSNETSGQFLDIAPDMAVSKHRLEPVVRGNSEVTGTEIVDKVHVLDKGSERGEATYQVDELAENHFVQELAEVEDVDEPLAELLIEEYGNPRTVSWATTSDISFLENTFDVDPHAFRQRLEEADVYRSENSPDSGRLHFPERRAYELSEERQEKYFDEVVELQADEHEQELGSQTGFDDF